MKSASSRGFARLLQAATTALLVTFGAAEARAWSCHDTYNAIKMEATDCGFVCDQTRLQPLQAVYEANCIVMAVPIAAMGFDSSPEPPAPPAIYSDAGIPVSQSSSPLLAKSQGLLKIVQTIGADHASRLRRVPAAEAFLGYCKSALARIPFDGPRVGLTEESGDRSDAQSEYARWQLATIFGDCVEAAYGIVDAQNASQETVAWSKVSRFLESDDAVRRLAISGKLQPSTRKHVENMDMFGTDNWQAVRAIVLKATETLIAEH